jgi:hypothetical protein
LHGKIPFNKPFLRLVDRGMDTSRVFLAFSRVAKHVPPPYGSVGLMWVAADVLAEMTQAPLWFRLIMTAS